MHLFLCMSSVIYSVFRSHQQESLSLHNARGSSKCTARNFPILNLEESLNENTFHPELQTLVRENTDSRQKRHHSDPLVDSESFSLYLEEYCVQSEPIHSEPWLRSNTLSCRNHRWCDLLWPPTILAPQNKMVHSPGGLRFQLLYALGLLGLGFHPLHSLFACRHASARITES